MVRGVALDERAERAPRGLGLAERRGDLAAGDEGLGEEHPRVRERALRRGVARALLAHLLAEARAAGATRVSLETGTAPMFAAANALYEAAGFIDGPALGGYPESPHNRFMTMAL